MKRNLCTNCEICEHNGGTLLVCADICNVPTLLLEEIERARFTYEDAKRTFDEAEITMEKSKDTIQTLTGNFVNNLFTN